MRDRLGRRGVEKANYRYRRTRCSGKALRSASVAEVEVKIGDDAAIRIPLAPEKSLAESDPVIL
jgi:hypothetical protein